MNLQNTISNDIACEDVGLHSGAPIKMRLKPAPAGHGIVFVRTDKPDGQNVIPALWNKVVDTQLCTVIANEYGANVGTIEHIMSALHGLNIDNILIEINGAEVPIMDGSSTLFVGLLQNAGIKEQNAPRKIIKILKEVRITDGDKWASLFPSDQAIFEGEIEFDHPEIGTQKYSTQLVNGNYAHDIASARTFGFLHEVEWMRSQGLAQGGSLENAIVLDPDKVMNPEGLRFKDEFIRHKLLDAIGDLYLAGGAIQGAYDSYKAGHAVNNQLLHALFADDSNYEITEDITSPAPAPHSSAIRSAIL